VPTREFFVVKETIVRQEGAVGLSAVVLELGVVREGVAHGLTVPEVHPAIPESTDVSVDGGGGVIIRGEN
jgi:hypothetical protein